MQVTIDRIEAGQVVVELSDRTTITVPRGLFPDAKEGDIYHVTKAADETAKRGQGIQKRFNRLKGG